MRRGDVTRRDVKLAVLGSTVTIVMSGAFGLVSGSFDVVRDFAIAHGGEFALLCLLVLVIGFMVGMLARALMDRRYARHTLGRLVGEARPINEAEIDRMFGEVTVDGLQKTIERLERENERLRDGIRDIVGDGTGETRAQKNSF